MLVEEVLFDLEPEEEVLWPLPLVELEVPLDFDEVDDDEFVDVPLAEDELLELVALLPFFTIG